MMEDRIVKNLIITFMKCNEIPLLWRKFFLNIANNRDYINSLCKRPYSRFDQNCREWYLYNLTKTNTEISSDNNLDKLPEYGTYLA